MEADLRRSWGTRLDLTGTLLDAGIVPSGDGRGADGGVQPERAQRDAGTQLYQVYVCMDPDGRTLVHCPPPAQRGCTDMINFPPF